MTTKKPAKEKLLTAACDIFMEKGFRGTTVAEICACAGTNIAAVNYYFGSKEALYQELGLAAPERSDAELIAAIAEHPVLLNRPIVVTPKGARLCRPPELVLDLIA